MKEIYILREDLYNEWAWENGATNLIVTTYDINIVVDKLKTYCLYELESDIDNRILEEPHITLNNLIERVKTNLEKGSNIEKVSVYESLMDYENGKDNGVFVIEKMEVKE
jgi:hypothetical protein